MFSYVNTQLHPQQRGALIHIPQTSGTAMARHVYPYAARMFLAHATASFVRYHVGESTWRRLFTFAFVRNPWERIAYWYELYKKKHNKSFITFEEFLERDNMIMGSFAFNGWTMADLWSQSIFLTTTGTAKGKPIVNFIGKHENVVEDFAEVCGHLGINPPREFFDTNDDIHLHYSKYYHTQAMIDIVAKRCAWEIKKFKYSYKEMTCC